MQFYFLQFKCNTTSLMTESIQKEAVFLCTLCLVPRPKGEKKQGLALFLQKGKFCIDSHSCTLTAFFFYPFTISYLTYITTVNFTGKCVFLTVWLTALSIIFQF